MLVDDGGVSLRVPPELADSAACTAWIEQHCEVNFWFTATFACLGGKIELCKVQMYR